MPLFEYRCRICSCKTERLRSTAERNADANCPICSGPCDRITSTFAIGALSRLKASAQSYIADALRKPAHQKPAQRPALAVRLAPGAMNTTFVDCSFEGFETAISAEPGSSLHGAGLTFKNNGTAIKAKGAPIVLTKSRIT